jgi:hypothetical protein
MKASHMEECSFSWDIHPADESPSAEESGKILRVSCLPLFKINQLAV